ncbi:MAG: helix-turn-helix domain-containing protein [Eubacterium sp.]|jgi:ribosome-binding protein aMBF1 (putative translation factor)|nr:helix-turn-helix domain-containing protein [Eubacterium sp.]MCH4047680.1 helix-turn-helix domain-containing protein [Eubacterium sp.]MCH4078452.1 helix-turn-helix domain-containing protein [Eubacterium sp.]MCH4109596.1 helix-turn-helix domain-containing protein [Eubacterium sp.]MCI1306692.1 helix-turn-helix domain-containing protein [Eubacterium sp.]
MTKEMNYKDFVKNSDTLKDRDPKEAEEIVRLIHHMVEVRNRRGISQRELARRCSMPQSSVARIETFRTLPNLVTLIRILQALDLTITLTDAE